MAELRLEDEDSYRKYMRMDTVLFAVKILSILLWLQQFLGESWYLI